MNSRVNTFWRRIKFLIIFVFWVKNFRTSGEKMLAGLSKLQFTSTEERFNIGSRKKNSFHLFWSLSAKKVFSFCRKILWRPCQKCKLVVQRNNLWENKFWRSIKFFIIFVFWAETFRILGEKVSAGLLKLKFERLGEHFGDKRLLKKDICSFWSSLDSEAIFWELWREHFSTVVLTAVYLSRGGVWAEVFFWHFWIFSEKFGIFGKTNFQQSCHICNLDIQRNVLRKRNFFEGFNYQIFFVLLPKKNWLFGEKKDR